MPRCSQADGHGRQLPNLPHEPADGSDQFARLVFRDQRVAVLNLDKLTVRKGRGRPCSGGMTRSWAAHTTSTGRSNTRCCCAHSSSVSARCGRRVLAQIAADLPLGEQRPEPAVHDLGRYRPFRHPPPGDRQPPQWPQPKRLKRGVPAAGYLRRGREHAIWDAWWIVVECLTRGEHQPPDPLGEPPRKDGRFAPRSTWSGTGYAGRLLPGLRRAQVVPRRA
jgi:hypothetical protein